MTVQIENAAIPLDEQLGDGRRNVWQAMLRGLSRTCPSCGRGALYKAFLKVNDRCAACGTELHHHRADDAPPYFTMFIVGHIVVAGVLGVEKAYSPELWVHVLLWFPLTIGASLILLPIVKGALIGLQWALRMHGFGAGRDPAEPDPIPTVSSSSETAR